MTLGTIEQHALAISEREICGAEIVYPDDDYPEAYAVCALWPTGDTTCEYTGSSWAETQRIYAEVNNKINALCAAMRRSGE